MNRRQINNEELTALFGLIGKGIWHLQNLEDALQTYITIKVEIKEVGVMNSEQAEELLKKHRANTLGTSLKIAKNNNVLRGELVKRLELFKEERDWLIHRSVHQNGKDLYLNDKRNELMERIERFSEEALALQTAVAQEFEDFSLSKGLSRKWIYDKATRDIARLKGEII
jgi:hypothetical protein